eukprot:scaffold40578_cov72-Cyclotella_meneghiniana.AAC.1
MPHHHNYRNFLLPYLKSQLVEMLTPIRFQSQQCIIIHHTHNESLEWSRCSGLAVTVPILTHFGICIEGKQLKQFPLPVPEKSAGGDACTN